MTRTLADPTYRAMWRIDVDGCPMAHGPYDGATGLDDVAANDGRPLWQAVDETVYYWQSRAIGFTEATWAADPITAARLWDL